MPTCQAISAIMRAMEYNVLGKTGLKVSRLSYGASALGSVFRDIDESEGIRAVHTALDNGINYIDVAPAYGATLAETVLGKALKGIPRERFFISTKVGKYTSPESYGQDTLDYSRDRIRASLDESSKRIGVDYFDIIHIHDIEYQRRRHTEQALTDGFEAVQELKREGRIGAVSFGIYPIDLWRQIIETLDIDAMLIHNHYCLNDTRAEELFRLVREKQIGMINASAFASGLLSGRDTPAWHPASEEDKSIARKASDFCTSKGVPIAKLALQFASQNPEIPTTMFSSANPDSVLRNIEWYSEPYDPGLLTQVQEILAPIMNKQWDYDAAIEEILEE